MKYFSEDRGNYNGILNYLWKQKNLLPDFYTNCDEYKGNITEVITKPNDSYVLLDIDEKTNESSYLIFYIPNYKIIPVSYQFSTIVNTSPPMNWTLSGSNALNGGWITLHSAFNASLCSRFENNENSDPHQCKNRVVNTFQLATEKIIGPFPYFKFTLYSNRATTSSETFFDLRIGGFEIFGALYEENEKIFQKITCPLPPTNIINSLVCMTFISLCNS